MTKARSERRSDVKALLINPDISPAKFVQTCWDQPEIDKIDLYRVRRGTPSKLQVILERGFPPDDVTDYLQSTQGDGYYRLSPVWAPDGQYITSRTWGLGDPPDEARAAATTAVEATGAAGGVEKLRTQMFSELRELGFLEAYKDFIAKQQAGAAERELTPMRMMLEMNMKMMELSRAGAPQNDALVTVLREELAVMRRRTEQLEDRLRGSSTSSKYDVASMADQVQKLTRVAEVLGFKRDRGGVAVSAWTPDAVTSIFSAAAPLMTSLFTELRSLRGAPAQHALPESTTAGGEMAKSVVMSEDDKLQVENVLGYLRERKWKAVAWVMQNYFHANLDPELPVAAILPTLRRIDPRFGELADEITAFMKYLAEDEA